LTETAVTCNVCFIVTRAANPERRTKLLDGIIDYILRHGLADLSLRPLAAAINESPRMLLYFFGSKERLIIEALTQIRLRQQKEFARVLSAPSSRRERLAQAWDLWSSPESEKSLWLFFEVYALALRNRKRFPGFLERLVKDWLPFFEQRFAAEGVPAERVQPMATFTYAAIRGLQLDLLATGERGRVDAAFRELLRLLSQSSSSGAVDGSRPMVNPGSRKKRGAIRR
jgi:AcrR family transcriptional regulator